jgi:hypothetical protein
MQNSKTEINNKNLLKDQDFKTFLQFESEYASALRGGASASFSTPEKAQRLIKDVNILTPRELEETIYQFFISSN